MESVRVMPTSEEYLLKRQAEPQYDYSYSPYDIPSFGNNMSFPRRPCSMGRLSYAEPVPSRSMFGARNFLPHEYAEEPDEALWYDEYRPGLPPAPSSDYYPSGFLPSANYSSYVDSSIHRRSPLYCDPSFVRPFSASGCRETTSSYLDPLFFSCDLRCSSDCELPSNRLNNSTVPRSRADGLDVKSASRPSSSLDRSSRVYSSDSQSDFLSSDTVSPDIPASGFRDPSLAPSALLGVKEKGQPKNTTRKTAAVESDAAERRAKKYRIDIEKVKAGQDTRRTVMLKNIPNSFTQEFLIHILESIIPASYVFVYMPVDFDTNCNLGFGYVSVSDLASLVKLYECMHMKKWPQTSSKKTCEVVYARIQGNRDMRRICKDWTVMQLPEKYHPVFFKRENVVINGNSQVVLKRLK